MASRWHRRSATTIRTSPLFSPAATTTWCKRRKTGSRFCANRSSYRLWTSPFVKLSNAAQRGMTASACCNSRAGAAPAGGNECGEPARADADSHNHASEPSFGCPRCSSCGEQREPTVSFIVLREQQNGPACGEHSDPNQVEVDPSPSQKIDACPVVDDE